MHPIFFVATQIVLSIGVVGYTSPCSIARKITLLPMVYCVVRCLPNCMKYMVRTPWAQLVGGASVTILYHYIDIALISRWSFLHGRPTGSLAKPSATKPGTLLSDRRPDTTFNRLLFGAKISSSYRFINTPFQIENVPPVSTRNTKAFLWRKTGVVVCSYLLLDLINSTADPAISLKYFTPDKVSLLYRMNEASVEELVIRAFTTLAAGISLNCVQGGMYNLFGLLSVGLGLSTPKEWPPFYGSLREAYTLRNFWEVYWHQSNTRKYSSLANLLVHGILKVPRGTIKARYLRLITAFTSSGIMHVLIDVSAGIALEDSGATRFFVTQILGLFVETILITIYWRIHGSEKILGTWEKAVGFIWVSAFLVWSSPSYLYAQMWRTNAGLNDSIIPYSFFDVEEMHHAMLCVGLVIFFTLQANFLRQNGKN